MMMKMLGRCSRLWLLGLALAALSAGCQDSNEGDSQSGIADGKGVADPKYAAGTPEQYRQRHQDAEKKAATAKGKTAAPKPETALKPGTAPEAKP